MSNTKNKTKSKKSVDWKSASSKMALEHWDSVDDAYYAVKIDMHRSITWMLLCLGGEGNVKMHFEWGDMYAEKLWLTSVDKDPCAYVGLKGGVAVPVDALYIGELHTIASTLAEKLQEKTK